MAAYRVSLSTTKIDAKVGGNASYCHGALGLTAHIGYHVWYPGNESGQADRFFSAMGPNVDDRFVAMIDVESWGGSIRGDHSTQITAFAELLAAKLGHQRVKVYANSGDLASIYPNRPAWVQTEGLIRAKYSRTSPPAPWVGWQYTDGQSKWGSRAGYPLASAPFGPCDHNAYLGTLTQFAADFGVDAKPTPPPAPDPTPPLVLEETPMILINKSTGIGVLLVGGVAVWIHDGTDATAMHTGGIPVSVVSAAFFQSTVTATGGGRGVHEMDDGSKVSVYAPESTTDLRPALGLS